MKKNYTSPVVELNVFAVEDVVMTSVVDPTPTPSTNMAQNGGGSVDTFTAAATGIVVQW